MSGYYGPNGGYDQNEGFRVNGNENQGFMEKPIERSAGNQGSEQPIFDYDMQERLKNIPAPSKKTQKLIGIAAAVVVVLAALFGFLSSLCGPKKTAEKYFSAALNGDWGQVYDLLEIPEGALMTKAHFLDICGRNKAEEVSNLKIKEDGKSHEAGAEFIRQYTAYFTIKGGDSSSMSIQMVRQKEKNFLFFSKWKVSAGNMLAKNFVIFAPSGYEISVDGEKLETPAEIGGFASESTGMEAADEFSGYDAYMENLFVGQHTVTASAQNWEPAEFIFDLPSGMEYYKVESLEVSQEAVSEMQSIAQAFMGQLYKEALVQQNPSGDYLAYWAQEGADLEEAQSIKAAADNLYEYMFSELQDSHSYDKVQFTSMNFSNFQSQVNENYNNEQGCLFVELYITYQYDYTYTGTSTSYQGITAREEQGDSGDSSMTVTFKLENGEWKIYSADMYSVY